MKTKRVLTLFLALVLLIGCMSGAALAEEGNCIHEYEKTESGFKCSNCNHEITVTNNAPEAGKVTNLGYLTLSAACAEADKTVITVTATPRNYKCALTSLTYCIDGKTETAIIGDTFTISDSVTSVTVNAKFIYYQDSAVVGTYVEADYLDSVTVDQYYIHTTGSEKVTYNRIKIEWTEPVVEIQMSRTRNWVPNDISWVSSDDATATVKDGTNVTAFTLTNYSINAFDCTMDFTPNDDLSGYFESEAATFDSNNGRTLDAVETEETTGDETTGNALAKYYTDDTQTTVDKSKLPSLTITGTLHLNMEKFKNAEATTENVACGNYMITCTKATN